MPDALNALHRDFFRLSGFFKLDAAPPHSGSLHLDLIRPWEQADAALPQSSHRFLIRPWGQMDAPQQSLHCDV